MNAAFLRSMRYIQHANQQGHFLIHHEPFFAQSPFGHGDPEPAALRRQHVRTATPRARRNAEHISVPSHPHADPLALVWYL